MCSRFSKPKNYLNNSHSFIVDLSIRRSQKGEEKDGRDEHVDTIPSGQVDITWICRLKLKYTPGRGVREPVDHPDGAEGDNHCNNAAHPSLHGDRGETDMHADLPVSGGKIIEESTTVQGNGEHTCA